jgi:hypothetical protein
MSVEVDGGKQGMKQDGMPKEGMAVREVFDRGRWLLPNGACEAAASWLSRGQ